MRALRFIAIFLVAGFVFIACSKTKSPEKVVEVFLTSVENRDYDKAKNYGTDATKQVLETLQAFETMENQFGEAADLEARSINDIKCNIDGNNAKCTYLIDDELEEIDLVKQNGKWLIDMKKENPF